MQTLLTTLHNMCNIQHQSQEEIPLYKVLNALYLEIPISYTNILNFIRLKPWFNENDWKECGNITSVFVFIVLSYSQKIVSITLPIAEILHGIERSLLCTSHSYRCMRNPQKSTAGSHLYITSLKSHDIWCFITKKFPKRKSVQSLIRSCLLD